MRAILIDPFKRQVSEIDTAASLDEIYEVLGIDIVTIVNVGAGHAMFLDDEGLLKPKEDQEYFYLKGADQPFAGRALILANVAGDNRGATLPLRAVSDKVVYADKETIDPDDWNKWTITTY